MVGTKKQTQKTTRSSWKKPKGKPKRPLSAYNYFFQHERKRILHDAMHNDSVKPTKEELAKALAGGRDKSHRKKHGKISFQNLSLKVAAKWKTFDSDEKVIFMKQAQSDKDRYYKELAIWGQTKPIEEQQDHPSSSPLPLASKSKAPQGHECEASLENQLTYNFGLNNQNDSQLWAPTQETISALGTMYQDQPNATPRTCLYKGFEESNRAKTQESQPYTDRTSRTTSSMASIVAPMRIGLLNSQLNDECIHFIKELVDPTSSIL